MTDEKSPPNGFEPWSRGGSPVTAPWEPIYTRETPEAVEVGTFIRAPLCNGRGLLHGGVIASLCDVAMGLALVAALRGRGVNVTALLTTHLSLDYIGKAERGWFRITTGVIQAGQSFGLVEATAFADDAVVVHAKASFRAMTAKVD